MILGAINLESEWNWICWVKMTQPTLAEIKSKKQIGRSYIEDTSQHGFFLQIKVNFIGNKDSNSV